MAGELAANSELSILVIEAGESMGYKSEVPFLCTLLQGTKYDWGFKTVRQHFSTNGLLNNTQKWPRGRGLGGSGQINYMLHSVGQPQDFDNWAQNYGLHSWDYHNFSCFLNGRNCIGKPPFREFVLTETDVYESPLAYYFKRAGEEYKFSRMESGSVEFNLARLTTKNGRRHSSYDEYLKPLMGKRKNLHVITKKMVSKIEIVKTPTEPARATGVHIRNVGFVRAKKEVILSAGTVQSPQLLTLSGIGHYYDLHYAKIPVKVRNDEVGRNLFDHVNVPIYVSIDRPISVTAKSMISIRQFLMYLNGRGLYSNPGIIGTGTIANSSSGFIFFGMGSIDQVTMRLVSNLERHTFENLFPYHLNPDQHGFVLLSTCYHPRSRGSITLRTSSIKDAPLIDPKYYTDDFDIKCTIDSMRLAIDMVTNTATFLGLNAKISWPEFKHCSRYYHKTDKYLECLIRTAGMTGHHPGGTCSMGKVVNEKLK